MGRERRRGRGGRVAGARPPVRVAGRFADVTRTELGVAAVFSFSFASARGGWRVGGGPREGDGAALDAIAALSPWAPRCRGLRRRGSNPPSTPAPIERRPADGNARAATVTEPRAEVAPAPRYARELEPARAVRDSRVRARAARGCGRREVVVPRAPPFASRAFQNETLGRSNSSFERSEGASFPSPRQSPIRTKSSLEKMSRARESRTPDRRSSNQRLVPLATASPPILHPPDATRSSREMRAAGSRRRRSRHPLLSARIFHLSRARRGRVGAEILDPAPRWRRARVTRRRWSASRA